MRESALESRCCRAATAAGWLTFKFVSPGRRGVPDRIFLRAGRIIFIEFKAPGRRPSPAQERRIAELQAENFAARIVDSEEMFSYALDLPKRNAENARRR